MAASWLPYASVLIAALMLLYNALFAPNRADRRDLERRLAKLETDDANHEHRLTGFSAQLERHGDRVEDRCNKIESQLSEVSRMREDLAVLKAKMEAGSETMAEIKADLKNILLFLRK